MSLLTCFECKRPIKEFEKYEHFPKETQIRILDCRDAKADWAKLEYNSIHTECRVHPKVRQDIQELALNDPWLSQCLQLAKVNNMNWRETLEFIVQELSKEHKRKSDWIEKIRQYSGIPQKL